MTYANIETDNGHDGFLLPNLHYEQLLSAWMQQGGAVMNRWTLKPC